MIIGSKELMELFGTEINKETYKRTKKINSETKESLLLRARNEYSVVEDLGRGKYKIENRTGSEIIIPRSKMIHPIFGNLIPAILMNVSEYHSTGRVFCLALSSIYYNFDMLNINYINAKNNKKSASDVLEISLENCSEFFDTTHTQLKYYLEKSLNLLVALRLIKYRMIPYVLIKKDKNTYYRRRASKEEEQYEMDLYKNICERFSLDPNGAKLFGMPAYEYNTKLKEKNIEYMYKCYEVYSIDIKETNEILNFYNITDKKTLSENFTNNFISIVISNAKERHIEAVEKNLNDFYRFNKKYLEDFLTLSNATLDYKSETLDITIEDIEEDEELF